MTKKRDEKVYDLEAIVTLAVTRTGYDSTLRWQLRGAYSFDPVKYVLESQDRAGSRWSSSAVRIMITDKLAEQLLPLFPAEQYRNSRTWLTLASICKKLGKTDVAERIATRQAELRQEEQRRQLKRLRNWLSDESVKMVKELTTAREKEQFGALSATEQAIISRLQDVLTDLVRAVPYVAEVQIGEAARVPGLTSYSDQMGVVLGVHGRTVRVDVKQKDGSAKVETFDAADVRRAS